ncbi:MAG: hypothetical protein FWB72_04100 [Firmicutes bacterium]|nr:hypothetical protein [Bacillota bacterium]
MLTWENERLEKEKQQKAEQSRIWQEHRKNVQKSNEILKPPTNLSEKEIEAWDYIVEILKSKNYVKTARDIELVMQHMQTKLMRDIAWEKWQENPERYVRIVTGVAVDGQTPKVTIKENEHYKILQESNKKLEKFLKDLDKA